MVSSEKPEEPKRPDLAAKFGDDLVLYYTFDKEEPGNKIIDCRTGKANARSRGAKWTDDGKDGGAYELKRRGTHYITIGRLSGRKFARSITISLWVRSAAYDSFDFFFGRGAREARYPWVNIYLGTYHEGNRNAPRWAIAIDNELVEVGPLNSPRLMPDRWYHVAGTYNGKMMYLYFDGKRVGSKRARGPIDDTQGTFAIGKEVEGCGSDFGGTIDNVMLFKRALTEEEIAVIYEAQQ